MNELTVGKAVWYVPLQEATFIDKEPLDTAQKVGVVARIHDAKSGVVDLLFFGTNDEAGQNLTAFPVLSVGYSAEKVGHSWHWIEKAEAPAILV